MKRIAAHCYAYHQPDDNEYCHRRGKKRRCYKLQIAGLNIIPSKVPLDEWFDHNILPGSSCYSTSQFIHDREHPNQTLKLKLPAKARFQLRFPGSHPVSLTRDNLQQLRQSQYCTSWKADGTRYMMLITLDGVYLIDRHFSFRRVHMRFPCRDGCHHHHYTLLDGEMVIDTIPNTRKQERRYLVYDMMAISHVSIVDRPFHERWRMIEEELIKPRNSERDRINQSRNPYYRYDMEPFRVRRKEFWALSYVRKLLEGFIPKLSHAADGLIFQGWDDPYIPRTHEGLLKWKYPEMNSVDFLFEVVNHRQLLYLLEQGQKKLLMMSNIRPVVVFPDALSPTAYSGKIIGCHWDAREGVWVFMRVRTDKRSPNEFCTYKKVMMSIKDNITEDILSKQIDCIVQLPLYANVLDA